MSQNKQKSSSTKEAAAKETTTTAPAPQVERKDPTAFLVLWLGSLAAFTILYAIFVHRLQ
jgi:hypothetical protein